MQSENWICLRGPKQCYHLSSSGIRPSPHSFFCLYFYPTRQQSQFETNLLMKQQNVCKFNVVRFISTLNLFLSRNTFLKRDSNVEINYTTDDTIDDTTTETLDQPSVNNLLPTVASGMKTTPHGGFSANEIYDMLRERDFVVKEIPKGQKSIHRFSHAVMADKTNDCKSKYLFWQRMHTTGTLLGRRKDKNGRPYLSITIH